MSAVPTRVVTSMPDQVVTVKRILVCADGADVGQGCTLGVELYGEDGNKEEKKPRLVLNLRQANDGGLMFKAGLLASSRESCDSSLLDRAILVLQNAAIVVDPLEALRARSIGGRGAFGPRRVAYS